MKKNDFGYPNGKKQVCLMIAREDTAGRRATWSEYQPTDADALSLCVAVEVKGSVYMPFGSFKSPAERDAAWKDRDRRAAWRNALAFAEQLWKTAPHRSYIVMYKPQDAGDPYSKEIICIYQKLPPLAELKEKGGGTCG